MSKILKRFVITFTLTVLFIMPVFSESWYLCLGSYKQEKNALTLVNTLKENGVDAVIDNFVKNGDLYYRVYLAEAYDNRDKARSKIPEAENLPIIKKLKITGIWICVGSDKVAPVKETVTAVPNTTVDAKSVSTVKKETKAEDVTSSLVIETTAAKSTSTTAKKTAEAKSTAATAEPKEAKSSDSAKTTTTATTAKTEQEEVKPVPTTAVAKSTATAVEPSEVKPTAPAKSTTTATKSAEKKSTSTAAKTAKTTAATKTSGSTKTKTTETKKTETKPTAPAKSTATAAKTVATSTEKKVEKPVAEAKVEEVKTEEVKTEEVKTEEVKTEEVAPVVTEPEKIIEIKPEVPVKSTASVASQQPVEPVTEENSKAVEETDEKDMVAIARKLEAELRAAAENKSSVTSKEPEIIPTEIIATPVEEKAVETSVENQSVEEAATEVPVTIPEEIPETPAEIIESPVEEKPAASVTLAFEDASNNTLKPNYSDDFLISEEKPYTVFVRTYKNIEEAEYDKNRLESYSIPSFVVKNYNEKYFFDFKLYAGGFEQPEQAEEVQEELKTLGVSATKLSDYATVMEASKRFNDVILNTPVKFYGFNEVKTPDTFSDSIKAVISKFPVNHDYQLEELVIYDLNQVYEYEIENDYTDKLDEVIYQEENTLTAALGIFEDSLFENQVTVLVESGEDYTFDDVDKSNPRKITIGDETYNGYSYEEEGMNCLVAINDEGTLVVKIIGNNLTAPLFNIYITTMFEDNYLYTIPNFRNSLCAIPAKNSKVEKRDFIYLVLQKIEEEVAYDIGFEHYAAPLANLCWTWSYFNQNDSIVEIMGLNLNYDYVANRLFEVFQDRQLQFAISEENRPSYVPFVDSWYTKNEEDKKQDLNIMLKSFILQLDVNDDKFTERDMVDFVEDMQLLSY